MKILHDRLDRFVTIRFENSFGVLEAINLPALIKELPAAAAITLDFRDVRFINEPALAALIPALSSIHDRKVSLRGLEGEPDEVEVLPLAA